MDGWIVNFATMIRENYDIQKKVDYLWRTMEAFASIWSFPLNNRGAVSSLITTHFGNEAFLMEITAMLLTTAKWTRWLASRMSSIKSG